MEWLLYILTVCLVDSIGCAGGNGYINHGLEEGERARSRSQLLTACVVNTIGCAGGNGYINHGLEEGERARSCSLLLTVCVVNIMVVHFLLKMPLKVFRSIVYP